MSLSTLRFPTARDPVTFDTLTPKQQHDVNDSFLDGQGQTLIDELAGVGDDADCVRHVRFWQREIAAHRAEAAEKYPRL